MSNNNEDPYAESTFAFILRFVRTIIILDAILFVIVALVCYFAGWRTLAEFSNGLFYGGVAVLALNLMTSSRSEIETPYMAFLTVWKAGKPIRMSYPIVIAGFVAVAVSIWIGLSV